MNHPSPHTTHPAAHRPHEPEHVNDHDHEHEHEAGDQSEILDLDAEVLAEHIASITAWLPVGTGPSRIVDLGCGTGAGTLALLERFPEAEVTAVDVSDAHLHRLREKAVAAGAADRVRIVRADLDATEWPGLGVPELVWASASLHHMADPGRALRQVHDLLAPGGLFAVVELAGFPGSCPGAPRRTLPGSRSAVMPHSTAITPSTSPTGAPTGEPSWRRPASPSRANAPSPSTSVRRTPTRSAAMPSAVCAACGPASPPP